MQIPQRFNTKKPHALYTCSDFSVFIETQQTKTAITLKRIANNIALILQGVFITDKLCCKCQSQSLNQTGHMPVVKCDQAKTLPVRLLVPALYTNVKVKTVFRLCNGYSVALPVLGRQRHIICPCAKCA